MSDKQRAFPERSSVGFDNSGMTLRQWYAGQALSAAVEDYTFACRSGNAHGKPVLPKFSETDNGQAAAVARTAYALADAMIEHEKKE